MTGKPRFVYVTTAAAVVSLVLSVGISLQLQRMGEAEAQEDCERAVSYRADGRAMWLYLLGTADPEPNAQERARRDAFVRELNDRIPPLKCVDGNPVPDVPKP